MHFEVNHDFPGAPASVVELMSDPEFQAHLELPDLSLPVVVAHEIDGTHRLLRLRYDIDAGSGIGTLSFSADEDAGRVNGSARVVVVASGDLTSRRTIAGDFRIRIPVIGGTAERKIVPGLVRRLDAEASAMTARLAGDGTPD